ncbi:MAG: sarcosine oxidase subunit delta [Alphaproteobacteria bacterium]|nr:sarcosine oxidase subunit delta [Alphaproteobacteria bacterium]
MKIMTCPLNGPRNISEFICGREVKEMPDPSTCSDETWAAHLFMEDNIAGEVVEWWMHVPTSYWFIARRNTVSEDIIQTYTVEEFFGTGAESVVEQAAA